MGVLDHKIAIVTGAATGIGRATALALAHAGAHVVVSDVDAERGEKVAQEVANVGVQSMFAPADVSYRVDVEHLVARTVTQFGHLDCAVNNAGIEGQQARTHECTFENWDRTLAVNLTGVFACMHAEIPRMLDAGGGAIVNVSSVAGLVGFEAIPAYTASKHGVIGLTKTAALEYATQGIRVNAVCPGVIATEMVTRFTDDDPAAAAQMVAMEPIGRLGTAEEIADTIVWLCSDQASFVTGQAIAIDGGFVAR
jgi:NAD(P)-dependent dehydrogenase (short-subunit alcohol dehydrogenase family)